MKFTPSRSPKTRSPGITVALPIRTGTLMPVVSGRESTTWANRRCIRIAAARRGCWTTAASESRSRTCARRYGASGRWYMRPRKQPGQAERSWPNTGIGARTGAARNRSSKPLWITSSFLNRFIHLRAGPIRRVLLWWQVVVRSRRCPGEGLRTIDSLGVTSPIGFVSSFLFSAPWHPAPCPVFFDNLALFRCLERASAPLILWELRPNWVRFIILAFGPLAPRP